MFQRNYTQASESHGPQIEDLSGAGFPASGDDDLVSDPAACGARSRRPQGRSLRRPRVGRDPQGVHLGHGVVRVRGGGAAEHHQRVVVDKDLE